MKKSKTIPNNLITCDGTPYRNIIETKFDDILPALSLVDQERIEQDIIENGVMIPLILWERETEPVKYELLIGHFEFKMVMKHGLPFSVIIKKFDSEASVICFIITRTLNRLHLNLFQKGELVLKHKEILTKKGKENMIKGGKGSKVLKQEKVDTIVQLSEMIGCSHDTLRKVQYILNTLDYMDDLLNQLRSGEVTINKVHEELTGKKNTQKIVEKNIADNFSDFDSKGGLGNPPLELDESNNSPIISQFHIVEHDKYQVVYIKPRWNLSNLVALPDPFLEGLNKMNIAEIVHNQFCTLFIQTPSKYLADTMKIIENWKFNCVDSICISDDTKIYSSNYSDQNHEILLVCELKGVGVPKSFIINRPSSSIIGSESVMETLSLMFDDNLSKVSIFSEPHDGWDTYDLDDESLMMLNTQKMAN